MDPINDNGNAVMDKGYAWVILFACSSIYVVMSGMAKAFGILYTELIKEFDTGAGSTAWIGSVMMFLFFGLGPISNRLAERFTFRKVIMVGGFLTSLGHFLSAFVPRMEWMYLTIGVISGSGCGFVFAPSTTIISFYFEKRRALAMGVVLAGAGLGSVVYPYFYRIILDSFGLRTSLIIVSGVLMYVPFVALLLREPAQMTNRRNIKITNQIIRDKRHSKSKTQNNNNSVVVDKSRPTVHIHAPEAIKCHEQVIISSNSMRKIVEANVSKEDQKGTATMTISGRDVTNDQNTNDVMIAGEETERERNLCCSMLDFSLFRIPKFTMYVLAFSLNILGYGGNFTAFPCYIVDIGYRKDQVAVAMSIIGATEVLARPFFGWFADLKLLSVKNLLIFSAIISGMAAMLLPLWESYEIILVYAVVVGIFPGAFWSLMAVALLESVTLDQLTKAMGLLSLFMAFGMVLSQPVAGWLKDVTGSWDLSFRVIGMFVSVAGLVVVAEPIFQRVWKGTTSQTFQTFTPEYGKGISETQFEVTFEQPIENGHETLQSVDTHIVLPNQVNEMTQNDTESVYIIPNCKATYL